MEEQSIIKKILLTIKKYILIIFTLIIGLIRTIFQIDKKDKNKKETKPTQITQKKQETQKETPATNDIATLPDEDNIKINPHDNKISPVDTEDTNPNTDVVLELPKQKLFKVYTKDNELKYLPLDALLDLIVKEELERIYKEEKFKLKTATTNELIKVVKIKERILPEIIVRVEKETLRTSEVIREEVVIKLEEDLEKNPLFPPRPKPITKEETNKKENEIYSLAHPKKKEIKLKEIVLPKLKKEEVKTIPTESKEELNSKLETINVMMVQTVDEIPTPTLKDNIKDAAIIGAVGVAGIAAEIIIPSEEKKKEEQKEEQKEEIVLPKEKEEPIQETKEEITPETKTDKPDIEEITDKKLEEIIPEEIKTEPTLTEKEIEKEIKTLEEKDKKQLEELKKQIEEKIQEIKKEEEQKKEEKPTEAPTEAQEEKKYEQEVIEVTEVSENVIEESKQEMKKNDFFEKDYDRIERQIDKMLEDITNTFLRYDGKLSEKQKKKLRAEETRLRETKKDIEYQKHLEIQCEQKHLDEPIRQSELDGLQNELQRIHNENKKEVSDEFLKRMDKLEGMTREQVANVDKRIMLKRFNKASLLLEMTSLLALPFVRNKHFFYFTVGLIIDNHFNFVNAFFNRKLNRYEPADLEQIRQGQDALNGALDITYKNLVELEYLEQRALTRYPELAYDPKFINETTRLRTNLNRRYNNLMRKNKVMEKYRMKSKKHRKILKPELKEKEAA